MTPRTKNFRFPSKGIKVIGQAAKMFSGSGDQRFGAVWRYQGHDCGGGVFKDDLAALPK